MNDFSANVSRKETPRGTIADRPVVTSDPAIDRVLDKGREVISRLTAAMPRTSDEERMALATTVRLLEQAFLAGVQAAADAQEQVAAEAFAKVTAERSPAAMASWR